VNLAAKDSFPAEALAYRDLQALEDSTQDWVTFPEYTAGYSAVIQSARADHCTPIFLTSGQRATTGDQTYVI
jgi:hypothetical protein